MLFTTVTFSCLFLPVVLAGFFGLGRFSHKGAALWLFVASVFFYGYWMPEFTVLLLASVVSNFWAGIKISALAGTSLATAVTNAFFECIKPHVSGRLVIVIDSDRAALNGGQIATDPARARFIALARAAGAQVLDTEPLFRAHLAQSTLKLAVGPSDGHLNKLGVFIAMQSAATVLCP